MIKRILFCFMFIFALVGLENSTKAFANVNDYSVDYQLANYQTVVWVSARYSNDQDNETWFAPWILLSSHDTLNLTANSNGTLSYSNGNHYMQPLLREYIPSGITAPTNTGSFYYQNSGYTNTTTSGTLFSFSGTVIVLQGIVNYSGYKYTWDEWEDFINPPPAPDPWYKQIWNSVRDYMNNPPWGENNIFDTLNDIWNVFTHSNDDPNPINYDILKQLTPTPYPTTSPVPTNIPYSTLLKPDANGNLVINYLYNNPQGTPTESPYNPNGNNGNGNGSSTYIPDKNNPLPVEVYPKENMMPYAYNQNEFNINNIDDYTDGFTQPLDEYIENVPDVLSVFSIIPDELYIVIGCIACIPLVSGIIKAFMK